MWVVLQTPERKAYEQLALAEKYLLEMDYEQAIAAYQAAIELDPKCEEAYIRLAEVYTEMEEYELAAEVLESAEIDSEYIAKKLNEVDIIINEMVVASTSELEAAAVSTETSEENIQTVENTVEVESTIEVEMEDHVMVWDDANLERAMREKTGIKDRDIMYSDVKDITQLFLKGCGITNIDALGEFTGLVYLDLSYNEISDISALSRLTNLTVLILDWNNISDISALSGLTNLTDLDLYGNNITDYSPVAFVEDLQY